MSIAFVVVKLKISKFYVTIYHRQNAPFSEVLGLCSPKIQSNFAEILNKGSTIENKNIVWKLFWRILVFMEKGRGPTLNQLWLPVSPWKWPKSRKISNDAEKLQPLGYPNMLKSSLYLLFLFGKNTFTFCNIWANFAGKQDRVTSQRVRIKIWQNLFHPPDSW